nr:phosphoenolpyruvate synthase [Deltaproteobacteria bacterium]
MTAMIVRFEEIGREDVASAGGKGANLGELAGKGFPVPPGFVVSAHACESFFKEIELHKEFDALNRASPDEIDSQCRKIQEIIEQAEIPPDLSEAILAAHDELVKKRGNSIVCAVRSSATAEDLGDASFAGQHATYYYVDKDRLLTMVKHCWASLFSPEAV